MGQRLFGGCLRSEGLGDFVVSPRRRWEAPGRMTSDQGLFATPPRTDGTCSASWPRCRWPKASASSYRCTRSRQYQAGPTNSLGAPYASRRNLPTIEMLPVAPSVDAAVIDNAADAPEGDSKAVSAVKRWKRLLHTIREIEYGGSRGAVFLLRPILCYYIGH